MVRCNIIGKDSAYSRGYLSMGVLHHLGLINDHKGIFKEVVSVLDDVKLLEESNVSDFKRIIMALMKYYHDDYSFEGLEYFIPSKHSPRIVKRVGRSQYTDGVRIEKEFHGVLNPIGTDYYTKRGTARAIKVFFNNRVFDAEYRYEGQTDKTKELQSIRFKKELKSEFKSVFPEPVGSFTIQYGVDVNHFVFYHEVIEMQYPEEEEKEYSEGRVAYRKHKTRERNPKVIKDAKERFMRNNNGRLYCEACF